MYVKSPLCEITLSTSLRTFTKKSIPMAKNKFTTNSLYHIVRRRHLPTLGKQSMSNLKCSEDLQFI